MNKNEVCYDCECKNIICGFVPAGLHRKAHELPLHRLCSRQYRPLLPICGEAPPNNWHEFIEWGERFKKQGQLWVEINIATACFIKEMER